MIVIAQNLFDPKIYCSVHCSSQPKCIETFLYARHCGRQSSLLKIQIRAKKMYIGHNSKKQ